MLEVLVVELFTRTCGAALGGFSLLGAAGAILALPGAAMVQAIVGGWGERHDVIESELTEMRAPGRRARRISEAEE